MLAEQDLSQMQEYILQVLPQLLRQNPEISTTIEGMLAHQFPGRDEFIQLVTEVKLLREDTDRRFEFQLAEMNHRFEESNKRFEFIQEEVKQLRKDMNRGFEANNKRFEFIQEEVKQLRKDMKHGFEEMEKRFELLQENMEKRFALLQEEVNLLREDINRRFEKMEKGFELLEAEMKRRFEEMDKRFELLEAEMNRRFEEMDKRFELLQQEVKLLREDTNRRFEEMEKRFELLQQEVKLLREDTNRRFEEEKHERLDMKRRMIRVESAVTRFEEKITQFDAWLNVVTGNIVDKRGQEAEQLFALGLSYGLKRSDIKPETIQLRQLFMDEECIVFPKKGKSIEVDILAENGKLEVFEVKTTAIETDVITFARKVQLIQHQNKNKQVSGIFISPEASDSVRQCCAEYDLTFVG